MQRYKQPHMDVHPDGEWIRYADHCEAMKRIAGDPRMEALAAAEKQVEDAAARRKEREARLGLAAQSASAQQAVRAFSKDVCADDVYERGQSIGLFDIPKETANAICTGITAATGALVDWHYVGGRVHMKALAAPSASAHPSEPIYQIWYLENDGSWCDVYKKEWDKHPTDFRRIVYTAITDVRADVLHFSENASVWKIQDPHTDDTWFTEAKSRALHEARAGKTVTGFGNAIAAPAPSASPDDINPVELIGAELTKCRADQAQPRDLDVLLDALNCTLAEHGFKVVDVEDDDEPSASPALTDEQIKEVWAKVSAEFSTVGGSLLHVFARALLAASPAVQVRADGFRDCIDAIKGAIAFGQQDTNSPPEGHWLGEFWWLGRRLSALPAGQVSAIPPGWKIAPDEGGWSVASPSGDRCYIWDADARNAGGSSHAIREVFRQLCSSLVYPDAAMNASKEGSPD